jgi:hypothetical protein
MTTTIADLCAPPEPGSIIDPYAWLDRVIEMQEAYWRKHGISPADIADAAAATATEMFSDDELEAYASNLRKG